MKGDVVGHRSVKDSLQWEESVELRFVFTVLVLVFLAGGGGMRERVRHFHGDLVIESDGSGTKVCATLPLTTPPPRDTSDSQEDAA